MTESDGLIVAHSLTKSFYNRQRRARVAAVSEIALNVRRGETYGLIGPDGAGKSTTLRLLNGLYVPDAGWARVAGHDTVKGFRAIHRVCGYMAQRFALYQDLSVWENLLFFAKAHGLRRAEIDARIPALLRFAGLDRFPDRRAGQLSGGMKKKLALATMLIHNPEIVFLDEPTLGVDPVSRREFWDLLAELRIQRQLTILVCTPYMDEAERCHRVGLIYEGRIIAEDTPDRIRRVLPGQLIELRPDSLQASEAIAGAPGVLELQTYGKLLRAFVDDAEKRGPELCAAIERAGYRVEGMRVTEPGMEEAFVHLIEERRGENHPQVNTDAH